MSVLGFVHPSAYGLFTHESSQQAVKMGVNNLMGGAKYLSTLLVHVVKFRLLSSAEAYNCDE